MSVQTEHDKRMSEENYWYCIIGPVQCSSLEGGCDYPMRKAVQDVFVEKIGSPPDMTSSGWGVIKEDVDHIEGVLHNHFMPFDQQLCFKKKGELKEMLMEAFTADSVDRVYELINNL